MSFFHYESSADNSSEQWTISPKFWVYWVVTIPVTALTICLWMLFQRWHAPEDHVAQLVDAAARSHEQGHKPGSDAV